MISDEDTRLAFLAALDIPDIVSSMLKMRAAPNSGFQLDRNLSLQVVRGLPMQDWVGAPAAGCVRHMAVFNSFRAIPEYCFDCYKVLVAPRTVLELFKLLLVYDRLELPRDNTRKCMIDSRGYAAAGYKGFVYCRSIEEGRDVRSIVNAAIAGEISPDVPVTLKRGCSEYAVVYPDYALIDPDPGSMKYAADWKFYERFADENFLFDAIQASDTRNQQGYPLREQFAMQYWLRYAASIGDMSYLVLTDGKAMEPLPRQ